MERQGIDGRGRDGDRVKKSNLRTYIILGVAAFMAIFTWIFFVDAVKPNAGEEAVLIKKPILFGHRGVDPTPVTTGRTYVWFTTDAVIVNMQPIQHIEHYTDLMSSDGVPLIFDSALRIQVTDSVSLVKNFGAKWFENNVLNEFRNLVRQAVRKHGMNETAILTTAIDAIDAEIFASMTKFIADAQLPIHLMKVTVGRANPPDAVKNQRVDTAAQEQRINTEKKRKLAEDARKEAEESRANADNAFRNAMQMSPEQYLRLESIKMQREVCAGGHCTFIIGSGSDKVMPAIMTASTK